jgi:two-component system, chemotaxis family, protein-glutamate methylesterase/glutaminase
MKPDENVRILIVDDSATARAAIRAALELDKRTTVVGDAVSGEEAIRLVQRLRPDLVTMDVYLSGTTGIDVTRSIMEECPTPILVVTAYHPTDPGLAFKAVAAGALDVCAKLPSPRSADYAREQKRLVRLVHALARVPVVRRHAGRSRQESQTSSSTIETKARPRDLIAIGASTGGPPVVRDLLRALPTEFPVPVVLVQHMTRGFGESYSQWLAAETQHRIVYVHESAVLAPATVFIASDNRHLRIERGRRLVCFDGDAVNYQRPSIDVFFNSVARELGAHSAAVLLTGMGSDGAEGLLSLRTTGALTIAQAPETCAVDSMPSSAIRLNAASLVLRPQAIAAEVVHLQSNTRVHAGTGATPNDSQSVIKAKEK